MAGEVRTELIVTLRRDGAPSVTSGAAAPAVGTTPAPSGGGGFRSDPFAGVGRAMGRADRWQLGWDKRMAMELARDRDAIREFQEQVWKSEALAELDTSSARRAADQKLLDRARSRDAFAARVRATRSGTFDDDFEGGAVNRRMAGSSKAASKRLLKGMGVGIISAASSEVLVPETGEALGVLGRVGLSTLSGGAWGGAPGAIGSFFASSISELFKAIGDQGKEFDALRKSLGRLEASVRDINNDLDQRIRNFKIDLDQEYGEKIRSVVYGGEMNGYREDQFQRSTLVGR